MLLFWGVTPLVGSIFVQKIVTVEEQATARTTASLMPLQDQSPALNTNFMMNAYGIIWLGQAMPGYVTRQGTLEPFEMDNEQMTKLVNKTWTAKTRLYGTTLRCEEAEMISTAEGDSYSNNKGCTTYPGAAGANKMPADNGLYIGYYLDQHSDYSLSGYGCSSPVNSHLFLALWGKARDKTPNANTTAHFCEPDYWIQDVNATVMAPSMNVSAVVPLGSQQALSDQQFNRSAFEYNIGTGAQAVSRRADISETTSIIDQYSNLAGLGFNFSSYDNPTTNMLSFALGLSRLPPAKYAEPYHLISSLEAAHKLLHALAVNDLLAKRNPDRNERQGVIRGRSNAIFVVRPLALTVESLLGMVVLLVVALSSHSSRRRSQLSGDPATMTDLVKTMPEDLNELNISTSQIQDPPGCQPRLLGGKIRLFRTETLVGQRSGNRRKSKESASEKGGHGTNIDQQGRQSATCSLPFEMSLVVGFAFLVLLGASLSVVVAVKLLADNHHGLSLPSHSTIVDQLLLNYVPIVFATFLEPFWLLLNRILCLLQPFQELSGADARSSQSLDLKYASLPPQLTIWRALQARHYVLSSVCAIGLSANLLAVSLNGLLFTSFVSIEEATHLTPKYEPVFTQPTSIQQAGSSDYLYVAKTNITDGVALPPWTVPTRHFVPFALDARSQLGTVQAYRATTQGFGIQANCEQSTYDDTAFITGRQNLWSTTERTASGRSVTCGVFRRPRGGQNNSNAALEVLNQLSPLGVDSTKTGIGISANASQEEILACNSLLVAGFLRGNLSVSFDVMKTDNSAISDNPDILQINKLSSTWMTCRPKLVIGPYNITVDANGYVQSYEAAGLPYVDLSSFFANGTTPSSLVAAATTILESGSNTAPYWHNDTFVDTWFGYFAKHLSNSTVLVDPAAPVPSLETVKPLVEDIYARLFAIVLSLNQDWLPPANASSTIPGTMIVPTQRVLVSPSMFFITVTLLALNMVVAIAYWSKRPKRMLPRMPYTIAVMMDLFQGSGLISDVEDSERWKNEWKFGYGRFVGRDGKPRVGIERRPFVIPFAP